MDELRLSLETPYKVEQTPRFEDMVSRLFSKVRHVDIYNQKWVLAGEPELSYPVEAKFAKQISQLFGMNPSTYYPLKGHDGIDWWLTVRTPIMAPCDMTITDLILQTNSYGRHAWGRDFMGNRYIFGHLNEWLCEKGDVIKRGQIFALSGGNVEDPYHGFSTGAHLHFELRPIWASISNGYVGAVDPMPYFRLGAATPIQPDIPEPTGYVIAKTRIRIRTTPKGNVWNNLTGNYIEKDDRVPYYGEPIVEGRTWLALSKNGNKYACNFENGSVYLEMEK
jgi:murein DD-endopeptidase MepM/ murein hydrolase activator NlpD